MNNYHFIYSQDKNNKDIQGYRLQLCDEELEVLYYDVALAKFRSRFGYKIAMSH